MPQYSELNCEDQGHNTMTLIPPTDISLRRPRHTSMKPTRLNITTTERCSMKCCLYGLGELLFRICTLDCSPRRRHTRAAELRLDNYQRTMDAFMIKLFPHPRIHRSALFIDVAFFPDKKSATCVLQPIVATGDFRIYQRVAFKSAGRPLALYECTWPETVSTPTPTPNGSHEYAWLSPGHMWLAQGPHAHERSLQAQVRDMQRLCNAMIGLVDEAHGKRWWSERWSKAWDEEPAGGARAPTRASKGFPSTKQLERLDEALEDAFVRVENTHRRVKVRNESGLGLCKVPTRGRGKTADGPEFRLDLL